MGTLSCRLRALFVEEDGAIGVITAITLPLMMLILGLVLDMSNGYVSRSQLQSTADASVLAAALSLGQDDATVRTNAQTLAGLNMPATTYGTVLADADVQTGSWDPVARVFTPNGNQRNAVQVVTRESSNNSNPLTTYFAELIGINSLDVNASAVAGFRGGGLCFLTLYDGNKNNPDWGVRAAGTSDVSLKCGIGSNSPSTSAVLQSGSSTVDAAIVTAVGQISGSYGSSTLLQPQSVTQNDPYANVNPPASNTFSGNCPSLKLTSHTPKTGLLASEYAPMTGASLGYKCLGGLDVGTSATLTLPSGVYVIDAGSTGSGKGDFNVSGTLNCNGCAFVLTNRSTSPTASIGSVSFGGSSTVDLKAQTTGVYKRLVIYQDRRFTPASDLYKTVNSNNVTGGALSTITGAFYMPTALLNYTGNSTAHTDCFQAVVWQLDFTGTTNVADDCPAGFGDLGNKLVRLVG